jgi:hypothetical protein
VSTFSVPAPTPRDPQVAYSTPDLDATVDALLAGFEAAGVHPKHLLDSLLVRLAEDTYGRGGFEQYNVRDEAGDLWGYTLGMADEDDD